MYGDPTGVLNKLWVWVWHSPKPQKRANIVMPNKLHIWVGTASAAEKGKMQYSCFSFNVYIQREAVTASSCSPELQCHTPSAENCLSTSPPCVATVYNKITGGVVVGLSKHPAYLTPALCMFGLMSVVSSISHHPQLGLQDKLTWHKRAGIQTGTWVWGEMQEICVYFELYAWKS
jgi:hypothetical protein